jgi:CheY-like chemotaxis protein
MTELTYAQAPTVEEIGQLEAHFPAMATVLLAEADRELREIYLAFLYRKGFRVETAGDGLECLAKLRQFSPDVLILDLEMLWGGGDGVLGVLQEEPRLLPRRIVLTSTTAPAPILNGQIEPDVYVLTKPFPGTALLRCAALPTSIGQPSNNGQNHGVLVVDDDSAIRDLL